MCAYRRSQSELHTSINIPAEYAFLWSLRYIKYVVSFGSRFDRHAVSRWRTLVCLAGIPRSGPGIESHPRICCDLELWGRSEQGLRMNDRISTRYNVQYQGQCVEPMGVSSQEFVPFHGSSA